MPIYEFLCADCQKTFTEVMPVRELETKKLKCPYCGSTKVTQIITAPHTITSKKS